MDTFPYNSWEEALAAVENPDTGERLCSAFYDACPGYFTWGPGGNTASIILVILAIAVTVVSGILVTVREDRLLNNAADRLAEKYSSED